LRPGLFLISVPAGPDRSVVLVVFDQGAEIQLDDLGVVQEFLARSSSVTKVSPHRLPSSSWNSMRPAPPSLSVRLRARSRSDQLRLLLIF
jgi:hypothetical protein